MFEIEVTEKTIEKNTMWKKMNSLTQKNLTFKLKKLHFKYLITRT